MTLFLTLLQYILPQHSLSRLAGKISYCKWPWFKNRFIRWFIRRYGVNMDEAVIADPYDYPHFNAFFTRALKPDTRPIDQASGVIISPADACISQCGQLQDDRLLQAKGQYYTLSRLLGNKPEQVALFRDGYFATLYLAPGDYHRVHMPIDGTLQSMTYIPGRLFSVNQHTVDNIAHVFTRNERVICLFDTHCGPMAVIFVGAMLVGSIETVWAGQVAPVQRQLHTHDYQKKPKPVRLKQGEEMGHFKMGSTVIVLFGKEALQHWAESCNAGHKIKMGEALATAASNTV